MNLFASDSSSTESDEDHEKEFVELTPVCTTSTKRMTPRTNATQSSCNEISKSALLSYVTSLELSTLEEIANFIPTPLSPLPETRAVSSSASGPSHEEIAALVINALPPRCHLNHQSHHKRNLLQIL